MDQTSDRDIPVDTLIKVFVKMRDKRSQLKAEFERQDGEIKKAQSAIEVELTRRAREQGVTGFPTQHGTSYITEKLEASIADDLALFTFIKEQDAFEMLERRLSRTAVKKYMEKHDGALPPGVNVFREFVTNVRRPSTRGGTTTDTGAEE